MDAIYTTKPPAPCCTSCGGSFAPRWPGGPLAVTCTPYGGNYTAVWCHNCARANGAQPGA